MKIKLIIVGLLVCVLLMAAYYVFGSKNTEPSHASNAIVQPPQLVSATSTTSTVTALIPTVPSGLNVPPEVAKDSTALAFYLAEMTPISFYGKVVDEQGFPIEGATAKIGITDKVFKDGSTYIRISDAAGLFSITGVHGLGVGITVSKDGYYRLPKSAQVYGYAGGVSSDGPKPTLEHPAVFVLRKKGAGVQLILKGINGRLPSDGTAVDVDLETGRVASTNSGNIRFEVWSNYNKQDANTPYDWKYRITVPGGGLIVRTDNLDFLAPSDGYQVTEENSYTASQRPYIGNINKQYFLKLKDGCYARITLSLGGSFNILAYINPTPGSRNLEYDPAKTVPKP